MGEQPVEFPLISSTRASTSGIHGNSSGSKNSVRPDGVRAMRRSNRACALRAIAPATNLNGLPGICAA